ncbi:MAG: TPM domain-containing protein [Minisyncoccia bacterium]
MFKVKYLLAVLILLPLVSFAYPKSFPNPTGFVTDTAEMLSVQDRQTLESELRNFSQSKGYEIALLTVPTLEGTTVEDYAVRIFEQWKIGDKKLDTGVLFLIARDDRQMRIEVGYGAEGVLTDAQSSQILNDLVRPLFKQGNYEEGIKQGLKAIEQTLSGEPVQTATRSYNSYVNFDLHILFAIFIIVQILVSRMARTKSWWFGGVAGAVISSVIVLIYAFSLALIIKVVVVVLSALLGFIIDYFVSKHWNDTPRGGGPNIWWLGGGRGGGGGGFGGFSGGSSGGGGSSSSW